MARMPSPQSPTRGQSEPSHLGTTAAVDAAAVDAGGTRDAGGTGDAPGSGTTTIGGSDGLWTGRPHKVQKACSAASVAPHPSQRTMSGGAYRGVSAGHAAQRPYELMVSGEQAP